MERIGFKKNSQANVYKGSRSIVIVLLLDGKEKERKSFPCSLEGNGNQFKYFRNWESKGKDHTWKRL